MDRRDHGDWRVWYEGDQIVVGWLPWRDDEPETVLITVERRQDADILVAVLSLSGARLHKSIIKTETKET